MFYKQFLTIIDELNQSFVEKFDYWLTTLPENSKKNISSSVVSSQLGVTYAQAEVILEFAENQKILERYYLAKCPDCNFPIASINKEQLPEILLEPQYCDCCEENKNIPVEDIYTVYKVVMKPDITEEEIAEVINKRLGKGENTDINFLYADSLATNIKILYETFYNPSESAYKDFKDKREKLDAKYGKNTTAKGKALEELVLDIFKCIKMVKGTNEIHTLTNQFDCTMINGFKTGYLSVFSYLSPYFIIECKNEPDNKPNNTYCNKLFSILETNEAQLGIVFGRIDATKTCFQLAREHYLLHSKSRKQQIVVTFSDVDLEYLIDKRVNILEYLEFKIFQVTSGSINSTFEMFSKK